MQARLLSAYAALRRWPTATLVALGVALLAATSALLLFAGVADDVSEGDGAAALDASRLHWIVHHRTAWLVDVSRFLNDAGAVVMVMLVAAVVSGLLWWKRVPLLAAAAPLVAVGTAGVCGGLIKVLVDRARPPAAVQLIAETDPSFPSGHVTGATALGVSTALVLAVFVLRRPITRALALLAGAVVPALVAGSRLELGVHWPTDVVAGYALGLVTALAVVGLAVGAVAAVDGDRLPAGSVVARVARRVSVRRRGSSAAAT
jgi:membrane-associated phospholipid phosphatase